MMTHNRIWLAVIVAAWVAMFVAAGIAHEANRQSWIAAQEVVR